MRALTLGPTNRERVVLFATGAGGDPERYRPLLEHLAAHDCQVIAPYFERFAAREATTAELLARPVGLVEALRRWASEDASVVVVGHSIGGWAGLCLAGATPWGRDGRPLDVPREPRVGRLVLYAPATGWFAAPGALDAVKAPMLVYAGEMDTITPVEQAVRLKSAPAQVDLRIVPEAGHFSFMDTPPPGTTESEGFDRARFLTDLAQATLEFAVAP
ncbi:alpha/beta hydrolase family protein [Streptomyces sp. NRRL S-37]|uniref:alpha/beta hydrolase family protein n=1 Tax=Streptomyces sp. NRRL S-37 TaxID=1463903 RepID=UPI000B2DD62E|nr:alpha/beta hydrolase [Streptomyces sp. NRRL S-37]